jgi:hypothetical protein
MGMTVTFSNATIGGGDGVDSWAARVDTLKKDTITVDVTMADAFDMCFFRWLRLIRGAFFLLR